MKNIKQHKEIVIITLIILGIAFYWFQIRPTSIKKDCFWVTEIVPADPGVTKEEAEINNINYEQCKLDNPGGRLHSISSKCFQLDAGITERPPQPEREVTFVATEKEYNTCLRQHGL